MRTRFLSAVAADHSSSSRNSYFLRLPLPQLPPPPNFSTNLDPFHFFDNASLPGFSLEIENFPIQNALSKFLSDVIPQDIPVNIDDFAHDHPFDDKPSFAQFLSSDSRQQLVRDVASESDNGVNSEEKLLDVCSEVMEGNNVYTLDAMGGSKDKFLDFEVTEPDLSVIPWDLAHDFQKEIMHIFAIESHAKIDTGMPNLELNLQNYVEVERAIYTIDDITPDYSIKQQPPSPEGNEKSLGIYESHKCGFPLFEVDETYLELFSGNTRDQLLIIEFIESQKCIQEVEQIVNENDLLGLAKFDLLKNLSGHLELCARVEVPLLNLFQEMELIVSLELSNTEGHSQEMANDDLTSAKTSFKFEELQYLELRSAYCFEIFSSATPSSEMVTCEMMFSEAMNFKNFSELIVSHELTLMDDSFKAMPVPILLDHEQMKPLNSFIEEALKLLEPQHSSTSDGLYLDWHFLVEDHDSSIKDPSSCILLQDINYCGAVYDFDTTDLERLVYTFILSDDVTDKRYSKEDKEILNIASVVPSAPPVFLGYTTDAALRTLMKDESRDRETEAVPYESSLKNIASSVEPISDFCELEYLIPLESDREKESKPYQESSGGRPSELVDERNTSSLMPVNCATSALQKEICTSESSFAKNIIIVNTLSIGKDMIICRRSSYRQVLALEKKGFQVTERDLSFPVDVIINAAVCLAWYNAKNIGKKAAPDDSISSLLTFVEHLAASILTSLSFSFSGCIMVFEGGSSYIAGIMESSDELYAAAASLGIDLQLFYSYSSDMTDEIILSCIKMATNSARDLYPKISDSETLAESFLTKFPSINPLSAHAILSNGGNLVNFLEWSPECRIRAVQKFQVPDESIALLSALSRFGEKENSMSGMTELSLSVSSATDSENNHYKNNSESKKRKYMQNHPNVDMVMHDSVYHGSQELLSNRSPNSRGAFGPFSSEIYHDFCKTSSSSRDEMFGQSQQLESKMSMMKHRSMTEQCDLFMTNARSSIFVEPEHSRSSSAPGCMLNGSEKLGVINVPQLPKSDKCFSPLQMPKMLERNNRVGTCNKRNSGTLQDDVFGEVINIDDNDYFGDEFDGDHSFTWSKHGHGMDQDTKPRTSYFHNSSPYNAGSHQTFPTAAEIESEGKRWFSEQAYGKGPVEGLTPQRETVKKQMPGIFEKGLLEECELETTDMSFDDPSLPSRRTPFSNAIGSTQLQQGSPWTIEFLSRMREKSKQKRQSNLNVISPLSSGFAWDGPKTIKRKSPSLLETYKFQGGKNTKSGNVPKKELKRQSRFVKSSISSQAKKPPIPIALSTTPVDKRARRKLSFSANGNGGQSKLVWER